MNRIFEGGHSGNASHSTPEVIVEAFTFNKYNRKAQEEMEFLNMKLMEEMVDENMMERFNQQKATGGEKGFLDGLESTSDDEKSETTSSEEEEDSAGGDDKLPGQRVEKKEKKNQLSRRTRRAMKLA